MDYIAVVGIAVGLAMDAFAVSVTNGAVVKNFKPSFALKIAAAFGIFQFMMPVIGWVVGKAGQELIENVDHYIAFVLLALIGGNMLIEAIKSRKQMSKDGEVKIEIYTEKMHRFNLLKPLVHQGGRVDRNFSPHTPVRVF